MSKRKADSTQDRPAKRGRQGPRANNNEDSDAETAGGVFKYIVDATAEYLCDSLYGSAWNRTIVYSKGPQKGQFRPGRANAELSANYDLFKSTADDVAGWYEALVRKLPNGKPSKTTHLHLNAATFAVRSTLSVFVEHLAFQYQARGDWQPDSWAANKSSKGRQSFFPPGMPVKDIIARHVDNFRQDRSKIINALRANEFIKELKPKQKMPLFRKVFKMLNEALREALQTRHGITMAEHGADFNLFIGEDRDLGPDFKDLLDSNKLGRADIWETAITLPSKPRKRKAQKPEADREAEPETAPDEHDGFVLGDILFGIDGKPVGKVHQPKRKLKPAPVISKVKKEPVDEEGPGVEVEEEGEQRAQLQPQLDNPPTTPPHSRDITPTEELATPASQVVTDTEDTEMSGEDDQEQEDEETPAEKYHRINRHKERRHEPSPLNDELQHSEPDAIPAESAMTEENTVAIAQAALDESLIDPALIAEDGLMDFPSSEMNSEDMHERGIGAGSS